MAAQDYDSQLLESVVIRRRRMRDALLFGAERYRRAADERMGKVLAGLVIAAVLCAGCVGWSFVVNRLLEDDKPKSQGHAVVSVVGDVPHGLRPGSGSGASGPPGTGVAR
ncbi:hypothetical protein GT204_30335 [Streptomyces sp. SID4919]|uniref:hypothetical protein n=1 Tax=unclassified Streptomyces TaxID=2593676 RepID=UPI000823C3B7|nr:MULTISPECIES: hypothetical protein [unclassified Streptomyces]MYY13068.1 hypothetical protein [Streptomyces sp. SID4919]SCK37376.1 hypothetical protein YW7DRAFT_03125 [Streptomyces sp. AmelKG-E11A]